MKTISVQTEVSFVNSLNLVTRFGREAAISLVIKVNGACALGDQAQAWGAKENVETSRTSSSLEGWPGVADPRHGTS